MSRKRRPESISDLGLCHFGRGGDPSPTPFHCDREHCRRRYLWLLVALVPMSLSPLVPRNCATAQFRNEDRIKISPETVQSSVTRTKNITSETVLHRITRALVRNRTTESKSAKLYSPGTVLV